MNTFKAELTQSQIDYLLQLISNAKDEAHQCEEDSILREAAWSALTHAKA